MTVYTAGDAVQELTPRIVVFGVGGAGGNAVDNMVDAGLAGVEFVAANTDSQALARSRAPTRLQLGGAAGNGLGAGGRPDVGAHAAEESAAEIKRLVEGAHMVFITAGMGGGTGTGAAPVVARIAQEVGALAVAVVTRPFEFEGVKRARIAADGIAALEDAADTLIAIPNQNLFCVVDERTAMADAFAMADAVLHAGVRGVTDLMTDAGLINLDFSDVRTVMSETGRAMMGIGEATGDRRAPEAALAAVTNPLLDDVSLAGAKAVLINITGGADMTLYEVDEVATEIRNEVDPEAQIIVGSAFDDALEGRLRVSVLATGIEGAAAAAAHAAVEAMSGFSGPRTPPRPPRQDSAARPFVGCDDALHDTDASDGPGVGPVPVSHAGQADGAGADAGGAPLTPTTRHDAPGAAPMAAISDDPSVFAPLKWFKRRPRGTVRSAEVAIDDSEAAGVAPANGEAVGAAAAGWAATGDRDLEIPAFLRRTPSA